MFGTANCSYSVVLDSASHQYAADSNGVLFAQDSLDDATHTVNLTALPSTNSNQQLQFDNIVFTDSIDDGYVLPAELITIRYSI